MGFNSEVVRCPYIQTLIVIFLLFASSFKLCRKTLIKSSLVDDSSESGTTNRHVENFFMFVW